MKKINEIIRDLREDNDLSQYEVANFLKIPRSTYGQYETGNSKISIDILVQLCKLYKTTPNVILGFSNDFPGLEHSKINKLLNCISNYNIDIDKLIELINLSSNLNR